MTSSVSSGETCSHGSKIEIDFRPKCLRRAALQHPLACLSQHVEPSRTALKEPKARGAYCPPACEVAHDLLLVPD